MLSQQTYYILPLQIDITAAFICFLVCVCTFLTLLTFFAIRFGFMLHTDFAIILIFNLSFFIIPIFTFHISFTSDLYFTFDTSFTFDPWFSVTAVLGRLRKVDVVWLLGCFVPFPLKETVNIDSIT